MYYQEPNGYMQDLNFYNQMNPNVSAMNNNQFASLPMQFNNNSNMFPYNSSYQMSFQGSNSQVQTSMNQIMQINSNLESMYPYIFRILNPVVERVIDGTFSRNQPINEDGLNNMVETVFNITEGQLDKDDDITLAQTASNTTNSGNETRVSTSNMSSQNSRVQNPSERTEVLAQRNRNNSLIRDIIRILIIRSLLSRNERTLRSMPNNFSQNFPMNNMF